MDRELPSLELAPTGTTCPDCGAEVVLVDPIFCPACFERGLEERERLAEMARARRAFETARARARAWVYAKAVQA